MTRKRQVPLGSVSHGTMREEDLIPRFCDVLEEYGSKRKARKLRREYEALDLDKPEDQETAGYILNETLFDSLNELAPDYVYFGAHEGDGSDYGFWVKWESIGDAANSPMLDRVSDIAQAPKAKTSEAEHVLVVNDHGNATLYRRSGNRWTEVWSVV